MSMPMWSVQEFPLTFLAYVVSSNYLPLVEAKSFNLEACMTSGFMDLPWSTGIGYFVGFVVLILGILYALFQKKGGK